MNVHEGASCSNKHRATRVICVECTWKQTRRLEQRDSEFISRDDDDDDDDEIEKKIYRILWFKLIIYLDSKYKFNLFASKRCCYHFFSRICACFNYVYSKRVKKVFRRKSILKIGIKGEEEKRRKKNTQECLSEDRHGIATLNKNTVERKPKVCTKTSKFVTAFPFVPALTGQRLIYTGARELWSKYLCALICTRMEDN